MVFNIEYIIDACALLYPSKCCHEILDDFTLKEQCLKTVISKSLGYGIIFGSTIVKLPQVIKIFGAKSGAGISVIGVMLELLAVTFGAAYAIAKKYPFSSWGESLFLMIETAAIAFLVLFYDSKTKTASFTFLSVFTLFSYILMSGLTPINVLWTLQGTTLPLVIIGKMIQALKNYQNGHTGQLSAITIWLLFLGAFVRIFTTIQETGDNLVALIYISATLANFVLLFQLIYYWKVTNDFINAQSKKKKIK